jgi:uncharacterized lipoprotein YddW (UPF0748 family)
MKVSAQKLLFSVLAICSVCAPWSVQAEVRGAWITTAWNLDWPSKPGLPSAQQKAELVALLDAAKRLGLTDVYFQVRPEGDAFYRSSLEPWSRGLTGKQGQDPGYDPLEFCISEAKKRGIRVHAWMNPYRARSTSSGPLAANHMARRYSAYAYKAGSNLWMDPGAPEVQEHLLRVVSDVARRYDVAGIHFDDYFYPYPPAGKNFPDGKTYQRYRAGGGKLSLADWRRDNVNRMVARASKATKQARPGAVFTVSPFGIYTKNQPPTVKAGLDQLNDIYADPVLWMRQGWVDYLVPQLYWRNRSEQCFTELLKWWRSPLVNPRGVPIYPGIAVDRTQSHNWPASEIVQQVGLSRTVGSGPSGHVFFRMKMLAANTKGVSALLKKSGY